jgi:hypothetical protein
MPREIFSQAALERLSSPEQLDRLVRVTRPHSWLALGGLVSLLLLAFGWLIWGSVPATVSGRGLLVRAGGVLELEAPANGRVTRLGVQLGDRIVEQQVLAMFQPSEGQPAAALELRAPRPGRVVELLTVAGAVAKKGQPLLRLGSTDSRLEVHLYVDGAEAGALRPGLRVLVSPVTAPRDQYGYLLGHVVAVGEAPVSAASVGQLVRNERVAADLLGQGAPIEVLVTLEPDERSPSGYAWSSSRGPASLPSGILCGASITVAERRPIAWLLPGLRG